MNTFFFTLFKESDCIVRRQHPCDSQQINIFSFRFAKLFDHVTSQTCVLIKAQRRRVMFRTRQNSRTLCGVTVYHQETRNICRQQSINTIWGPHGDRWTLTLLLYRWSMVIKTRSSPRALKPLMICHRCGQSKQPSSRQWAESSRLTALNQISTPHRPWWRSG